MKHFRLLLTLFALMLGWTNVSAQTWTADEVGEGYYLLYNVGTSQYFTRGNGWGTQASISVSNPLAVELISFEGKYKIRTGINGQDYGLENLSNGTVFVDQSREKNSTWELEQVGTDNGPIYTIKSVDNHGGGSGAFLTAEGGSSTIVGPGTDGTIDNAKWKILSLAKNATINGVENASETNPVDVSIWIKNNNFSYTITQPWTMVASNRNLCGGDVTNLVAESWRSTFTLSQTISVPNGQYKLRAQAAMTEYTVTGNDLPVVYLNDATVPFNAMTEGEDALSTISTNFAAGKYYTNYTDVVTVTSGNITVGVKGTRTDTWCTWDNFQLQYLGPIDLSAYVQGLSDAVAAAEATQGTIPTAAYNAIAVVVSENNKTYDNADDYSAAIQAINNAVATYASTEIVSAFSKYLTLKSDVQALYDVTGYEELTEGAHEVLGTALTTAITNVETCTEIAQINEIAATLKAAGATYAGNANPTGEAQFNLTFMMTNPNLEGMPIRQSADGWSTEQEDGNSQVMTNGDATSEDGTKTAFYEYWTYTAKTNGLFNLYNAVTLPEGTYTINCYAFAQDQYAQTYIKGIYFYANDTQGTCVSSSRLTEQTISFINDQEQEVKIGLKSLTTGNSYNWMGIGYVQLYKVPARTTIYSVKVNATNATVTATVDGEETTEALALKTVTLNVTADEGCAITAVTATYTDGGTETALEVATPQNGVYTFQMPEHDVNVTVVAVADKTALASAITAAEAFTEGTLPSSVYTTLTEALATANTVNNNSEATVAEVAAATTALEEAIFTANIVKAPFNRYTTIKAAIVAVSETNTTEADKMANDATTAEAIETAVSTVRSALSDYLTNADIVDDHIDLTDALIDNPRPGITGTTDYWTNSSSPGLQHNLYEFYNVADATTKQTLATILPIGYYTMTVVGYTREGYDAFMSAGENKQTLIGVASDVVNDRNAGSAWIADGNGVNEMTFQLTEATADLEIGINTGKTGDKWTCWRSFKLEYLGTEPLSVFNDQLQTAIDVARTTANELDVPAGVATVLTSLATDYETEKANYTTAAQYTDAIAAIAAAVKAAESAVHPTVYNNLILQKAITTAALDKLADENEAALQAVIDANADALAACKNVEEIEARTTVLWTAIADALGTIELTGDETLNLTYLLTNPDLTNCPVWKGAEGWYTDQTDGNSQVMTNDAATSEDGTKTAFYEYWSNPAKANNLFTLYQKVTLPPGTFDISCYAFAQDQYAGQNSVGVYFYANDTQGSSVSNTKLSEASLSFINDTKQEVKIGLKTISGNTYNWMGIGYMELYMVAPNTTEYAINTDQVQNATVVATVDDKVVATALSLKNVTITVTPAEGFVVENVTVTYTEGEETKNVELSTTAMGAYTFQMPAFDVTVNVTTAKLATDAELTALAQALQPTAKLGFEKDDYAPYNNVESLTAAEAEIAKVYAEMGTYGKATQATVLAATQAIGQLNWVANTAEVNAFFDGSFASEYSHEGNVMPIGWHGVGDKDNATNVRLMWNVESNAGLNAASNKQAAFAKFTAEYGTEVGYTLPLKAGVYDLKFIYGGWNEVGTRDIKVYNTENDAVVAPVTITAKDNQAHTTADSWSNYEGTVTIPADGNYVFSFYRENTTNQNQLVFSDITLYKAKAKKGDVNGDGNVNVADVTALVNALQKGEQPADGDLDGVEGVDANDVKALVDLILHNE